jgi:cytoskeleton protein RodZ
MPDIDQEISQKADVKGEEEEPVQISGLGALLRSEREKRGLSYDQITEVTRLRKHYVEALENEQWDDLPPAVFVRGFIRSYTQALGLDEKRALDLYESIMPDESASPKPLEVPPKVKKDRPVLLFFLLGALAIGIFIWQGYPPSDKAPPQKKSLSVSTEMEQPPAGESEEPALVGEEFASVSEAPESVEEQGVIPTDAEPNTVPEDASEPGEGLPTEEEQAEPPADEALSTDSPLEPDAAAELLVLKGTVNAKTWLRIYVDDQEPKEYIFHPGSRPQWKAKKGFHIIIGNAAGMEFDFNGKQFANLGKLGQVRKLNFPEDFEVRTGGD